MKTKTANDSKLSSHLETLDLRQEYTLDRSPVYVKRHAHKFILRGLFKKAYRCFFEVGGNHRIKRKNKESMWKVSQTQAQN